jgi:hypothetical protein
LKAGRRKSKNIAQAAGGIFARKPSQHFYAAALIVIPRHVEVVSQTVSDSGIVNLGGL